MGESNAFDLNGLSNALYGDPGEADKGPTVPRSFPEFPDPTQDYGDIEYTTPNSSTAFDYYRHDNGYGNNLYPDYESVPSTTYGSSSNRSRMHPASSMPTTISRRGPQRFEEQFQTSRMPSSTLRLPCEFDKLTGCTERFGLDETQQWSDHVASHLRGKFPKESWCWFCDDFKFNAQNMKLERSHSFEMRLEHIREHLVAGEFTLHQRRRDYPLLKHLRDHKLIPQDVVKRELGTCEGPKLPKSHSPSRQSHKHKEGHRHDLRAEDRQRRKEDKKKRG